MGLSASRVGGEAGAGAVSSATATLIGTTASADAGAAALVSAGEDGDGDSGLAGEAGAGADSVGAGVEDHGGGTVRFGITRSITARGPMVGSGRRPITIRTTTTRSLTRTTTILLLMVRATIRRPVRRRVRRRYIPTRLIHRRRTARLKQRNRPTWSAQILQRLRIRQASLQRATRRWR